MCLYHTSYLTICTFLFNHLHAALILDTISVASRPKNVSPILQSRLRWTSRQSVQNWPRVSRPPLGVTTPPQHPCDRVDGASQPKQTSPANEQCRSEWGEGDGNRSAHDACSKMAGETKIESTEETQVTSRLRARGDVWRG
jgi:hypothetical protein